MIKGQISMLNKKIFRYVLILCIVAGSISGIYARRRPRRVKYKHIKNQFKVIVKFNQNKRKLRKMIPKKGLISIKRLISDNYIKHLKNKYRHNKNLVELHSAAIFHLKKIIKYRNFYILTYLYTPKQSKKFVLKKLKNNKKLKSVRLLGTEDININTRKFSERKMKSIILRARMKREKRKLTRNEIKKLKVNKKDLDEINRKETKNKEILNEMLKNLGYETEKE